MELTRRSIFVYVILGALWVLVLGWQVEEHLRVRKAAKTDLSNRSKDIANSVSACIRGMRFRGTVLQERLEPLLNELVSGRANEVLRASDLVGIALLNAAGTPVASAGRPIDFGQQEILQRGERWGPRTVTFVNPVDLGAALTSEGATNPTVVLPPMHNWTNTSRDGPRPAPRQDQVTNPEVSTSGPPPSTSPDSSEVSRQPSPPPEEHQPRPREGEFRSRRPPWMRGMDQAEYQSLMEKRSLHGLVLSISTDAFRAACNRDLWLRAFIMILASVSVVGSSLAWRNVATSSELQIRLVRASEMNTHLKEMNLAAAGLAHETRNPLNIIRGLAQMISKQPATTQEICEKSRAIVEEADKVAAQLNEFINYSRPRELRRSSVILGSVVNEVVRALTYDLEEKNIRLVVKSEQLKIEADEQLLRQALFNLLLNAVQAVNGAGEITVAAQKRSAGEASLEVRDNGPGVPQEQRSEIFKPYFTTQKTGTGLGLAVVQQIVLAHGWEIECLGNQPSGAIFRITHLRTSE